MSLTPCPVCLVDFPSPGLQEHMKIHSKDEIVAALLQRSDGAAAPVLRAPQAPLTRVQGAVSMPSRVPFIDASSAAYSGIRLPPMAPVTPSGNTQPMAPTVMISQVPAAGNGPQQPVILPTQPQTNQSHQVMFMSPVLIPQPSGPPIMMNMPSYVYHNPVGLVGGIFSGVPPTATAVTATSPRKQSRKKAEVPQPTQEIAQDLSPNREPEPVAGPSGLKAEDGRKVCSVSSVSALQKVLQSEEDVQIVVPNDLLETEEFKSLIGAMTPNNTPATTRPPSAALEEPESPQPGPSKSQSPKASKEDEEDLSMHDLLAMETMDDAGEEDKYFPNFASSSSGTNPLESYMNSMFQPDHQTEQQRYLNCPICSKPFGNIDELEAHTRVCTLRPKKGIGKKSKKSKKPSLPPPEQEDDNAISRPPSSQDVPLVTDIKQELSASNSLDANYSVKSELMTQDSNSQLALGSAGDSMSDWKCNICKVNFDSGLSFNLHLEELRKAKYKCDKCHKVFEERKYFQSHRKQYHDKDEPNIKTEYLIVPNANGEYSCDRCSRAFKEKEMLIKHMSCHIEEKPFECLECGKKFVKSSQLKEHRRRHFEVGNFSCEYCKKTFFTSTKLMEHVRTHTGETPLTCNICGKGFKRHSNLSEHKRRHTADKPSKPPKELFCECGKKFPTQRALDWHREATHDQKPKKCTFCGEVFVHSTSLTRHIRQKHQANFVPSDKKSSLYAACPICQQTFYKTSIHKHIRIKHQGLKPYECENCKQRFVSKCNLDNHMWQHQGMRNRPFKCQLCKKAYARQCLLDSHMLSHKGIKPCVCNDCGLQFANKSNLQRHVAEHDGVRSFECSRCDKKFTRKYYLDDHMKVHTGDKPFYCQICGKTAATKSNYNSHLRTHITREPVNSEV